MMEPKRPRLSAGLTVACAVVAFGCTRPVEMIFDLEHPLSEQTGFFHLGFPTDLRLDAEGRVDLSRFPRPGHPMTEHYVEVVRTDVRGYALASTAYVQLSGPIDRARLPQDPGAYRSVDAPVQIVDIDPDSPERGRRLPLEVAFTFSADTYRPPFLLQALPTPGFPLRENTSYALIVTGDVPTLGGAPWSRNEGLADLLAGEVPPGALGAAAADVYAPLVDQLALDGIPSESIVAATVWTTGAPTAWLEGIVGHLEQWPAPVPDTPLVPTLDYPEYCVLESTWTVPGFQNGTAPYVRHWQGGTLVVDREGAPVRQYTRSTPLIVTIPKRTMPAGGYPLLFFLHGTGDPSHRLHSRGRREFPGGPREPGGGPARIAADRGFAASIMGGHLAEDHLDPLTTLSGILVYNAFNPRGTVGNFTQMVAEEFLFRRLIESLEIAPSLCPEADASAAPDGVIRVDPNVEVLMGNSLGSFLGSMLAAVDPRPFKGLILTGAGSTHWIEFPFSIQEPFPIEIFGRFFVFDLSPFEPFDRWHPMLALTELAAGSVDSVNFLGRFLRQPLAGKPAPHVLAIEGHVDPIQTANLQQPTATAFGLDLVGPEVAANPADQLLPRILLAGGARFDPPVSGNVTVPDQGPRTAAVVVYAEDGILSGHHVAFQLDAPKHQYGCFLEDIAAGKSPTIIEGSTEGAPCAP